MKIKQYIVTYNNNERLNACIKSMGNFSHEVYIVDNYGNAQLDNAEFYPTVTILRNVLRPSFSTGHLAKDWNAALVLGFQNLKEPDADIVILNQNDTLFQPNYVQELIQLHTLFDFVQLGAGDEVLSFTPNAVRQIGLFDERFSNIGFQEADYLLRAIILLPTRSTINDEIHDRLCNPIEWVNDIIQNVECGHNREEESTMASAQYHTTSAAAFFDKWHGLAVDRNWSKIPPEFSFTQLRPKVSYIMYPYFEKDIETLTQQNFLHLFGKK
jgi:hypothetical protein